MKLKTIDIKERISKIKLDFNSKKSACKCQNKKIKKLTYVDQFSLNAENETINHNLIKTIL